MPENHQKYLSWNGDRFRRWAKQMGESTLQVVESMLTSRQVEQQAYRSCMGLLKLAEKYSSAELEAACGKALSLTGSPSYKSIRRKPNPPRTLTPLRVGPNITGGNEP